MAWVHCLQRETVHIYTRRQPRQARHEQWRLGCNQLPDRGFQQAAPRAECTASPSRARRHTAPATVPRAARAQRPPGPRNADTACGMNASPSCTDGHPGEADGFTSWAQPPGNWHSSSEVRKYLTAASWPTTVPRNASLLRVPPGVILDRAAIQVRGRQAALGDAGCHCGPRADQLVQRLVRERLDGAGGAPCRTGRGAGESNRCGERGRSELVVALNPLSFTSHRRSLCSARWRVQGWRGESDRKPLTKSGSPGCQVRRGGSKAIPSGRHQDLRRLCGRHRLLGPSFTRHSTLSFRTQAGWLHPFSAPLVMQLNLLLARPARALRSRQTARNTRRSGESSTAAAPRTLPEGAGGGTCSRAAWPRASRPGRHRCAGAPCTREPSTRCERFG